MTATTRLYAAVRAEMGGLPLPVRTSLVCALVLGVLGGVCGLVLGLAAYPPTAWFAVLEVGVPAALVGALVGLLGGGLVRIAPKGRRS